MKTDIISGQRAALIEKQQFYSFMEQLQADLKEARLSELEYELSGIMATYDALIDYFGQGADDPERDRVYRQLVGRALLISDRCAIAQHGASKLPYYMVQNKTARHESLRVYQLQLETFAEDIKSTTDMEELKRLAATHDTQLSNLFVDLWTLDVWNATTASEADGLLLSSTITAADQCTIVSAVTLSLLRMFDPLKMLFLCDAYYHPQTAVSMRALVGIVVICYCWGERMAWYSEVKARLSLLTEDPIFSDQVCEVVLQFIRSTDTEEIDRKMREEIIPGLMKNPKLRNMPGITKEDIGADDINPDWEQWMHESGLEESMREITEWQMEGADVNMSTFAQLKRYPFFYNIMNWFRPFDMWQADVLGIVGNPNDKSSPLASTVLQSNFMCDSDKYSFCYAIREIPQMQRDAMMAQFEEQNRALKENADMPDLKRLSKQTMQSVMRQYVQNLYRFFKLFPNVKEFDNPFDSIVLCPHRNNPLYQSMMAADILFKFVGLSIKRKDYDSAISYFRCLEEWHPDRMEATQLQQFGLCFQKEELYENAIELYTKADILQPDSYWTILHLAQCYRAEWQCEKALEYYKIAESMKPDNLNLAFVIAELHYNIGEYEEAFPYLHKIDYHHPESLKTVRLLAECSLQTRKFEHAVKYYERILAEHSAELTVKDLKYAAYGYLLLGERDRFFAYLMRAERLHEETPVEEVDIDGRRYADKVSFAEEVRLDISLLHTLGVGREQSPYLYDAYCRYKKCHS